MLFPDHFYEVMGAVVIIHWKKEPTMPVMGSILGVDEVEKHSVIKFTVPRVKNEIPTLIQARHERLTRSWFGA